jgi:serine O-acetyltransferase
MLREDLDRYNEARLRPGTLKYYRYMLRQAHTHPGMVAVIVFRYGGWARRCRIPVVRQVLDLPYHFLHMLVRFGLQIELPRDTQVGPGLRIDHYGSILINSMAVIGRNFSITHGVLVGGTETGTPVIGDDVHCGVGAKIIGGITLGSCIKIGAGAIVTKSFGGNVVLAGVPARVLRELRVTPERNGRVPLAEEDTAECDCEGPADDPDIALISNGEQGSL